MCAGIAEQIDADAIVVRIFAILLTMVTFGLAVFVYAFLWVRLPFRPEGPEPFDIMPESAESSAYGPVAYGEGDLMGSGGTGLSLFGRLAVAACLMVLFLVVSMNVSPLVPGTRWWQFWPIAFIIMGICLIIVPIPGEHEDVWHAGGVVLMSASAMILPMVLKIASWRALVNSLMVLWPLLVIALVVFIAGVRSKQSAPIVIASIIVAAFCLMTLYLFASTDVSKLMTMMSLSGKFLFG